jgi:hypothetical protein
MSSLPSISDEFELRRRYLFRVCESKEELHDWILIFLGLDLPDCIVSPESNSSPMDMVWEVYSKMLEGTDENFMRVLYYASRDSFKTLGVAIIEVLAVFHCSRNVAHMAAIQDQALKAQEYVKRMFRRRHLSDFVIGNNERVTKLVRYYNPETKHSLTTEEFTSLSASEQAQHEEIARALLEYVIDEVDVVSNPAAYEEAQNIPAGRGEKLPITVLVSTRKQAFGLVQKEIDRARRSRLNIRHWNIIDVTKACEPARHRPDLPRLKLYVNNNELRHVDEQTYGEMNFKEKEGFGEAEGFAGCRPCRLFTACRGRLATHQKSTSLLLKSIPETIGKFDANSTEMAKAQLLCLKPSSVGLIYSRFDKTRHVISPAQAYEKVFGEPPPDPVNFTKAMFVESVRERQVKFYGGLDWGHTHNFSYIHGFKDGPRLFVTHCISFKELDPEQMLDVCEPFKRDEPSIYADTADPKMAKMFKKYGHRMMTWKKEKVVPGINVVRWLMNPPAGEPNLYIVHDLDEDPGINLLVNHIAEYHWKTDAAGRPTDIPDEEDDDEPDALRYLVTNVFSMNGKLTAPTKAMEDAVAPNPFREDTYTRDNWAQQMISQLTGRELPPQQPSRPQMVIDAPKGSGYTSYYGQSEDGKPKPKPETPQGAKGKKGNLHWDI